MTGEGKMKNSAILLGSPLLRPKSKQAQCRGKRGIKAVGNALNSF